MSEIMECEKCGGLFTENDCRCEQRKLKRELNVMTRLFYCTALREQIPPKLLKKYNELMGEDNE